MFSCSMSDKSKSKYCHFCFLNLQTCSLGKTRRRNFCVLHVVNDADENEERQSGDVDVGQQRGPPEEASRCRNQQKEAHRENEHGWSLVSCALKPQNSTPPRHCQSISSPSLTSSIMSEHPSPRVVVSITTPPPLRFCLCCLLRNNTDNVTWIMWWWC